MPAHLFCKTGEFAGVSFDIERETTIGRGPDGGMGIPSEVVSGQHARIYFDEAEGGYFLEDLQSRNGTRLDGVAVTDPVKLGPLHVVTIADRIDLIYHEGERKAGATTPASEDGQTQFVSIPAPPLPPEHEEAAKTQMAMSPIAVLPPESQDVSPQTRPEEPAPPPDLPVTGPMEAATIVEAPRFALDLAQNGGKPDTILLTEGENTVGRAADCAVTLDTASVSRQHAVLTVRAGRVTVRDLGSRNKTFLEGEPVTGEVEISPGAALRFGIEIEATLRRA